MLILSGWGAWVALFFTGVVSWLGTALFGTGRVYSLFFALMGAALFAFGQFLHENDTMTVIDPTNGQAGEVRNRHHIFWVSVRWWGIVFVALGVLGVVVG